MPYVIICLLLWSFLYILAGTLSSLEITDTQALAYYCEVLRCALTAALSGLAVRITCHIFKAA